MPEVKGDGDSDLILADDSGLKYLRNDGGNQGHWLSLHMVGRAVGAQVRVVAGDLTQVDVVRTGSSYLCQSAMRPFFGLGDRDRVDEVEIRWPSGAQTDYEGSATVFADGRFAFAGRREPRE